MCEISFLLFSAYVKFATRKQINKAVDHIPQIHTHTIKECGFETLMESSSECLGSSNSHFSPGGEQDWKVF